MTYPMQSFIYGRSKYLHFELNALVFYCDFLAWGKAWVDYFNFLDLLNSRPALGYCKKLCINLFLSVLFEYTTYWPLYTC